MTNLEKIEEIKKNTRCVYALEFERTLTLEPVLKQEKNYIAEIIMLRNFAETLPWLLEHDLVQVKIGNNLDFLANCNENKILVGVRGYKLKKMLKVKTNNPDEVERLQEEKWETLTLLEKIETLIMFFTNELEKCQKYGAWLKGEFEQIKEYEPYGEYEEE